MSVEDVKIGPFRIALLFLLGVNYVIVSMNHALPTFHNYTPDFHCKVKGVEVDTHGCVSSWDAAATNTTPVHETGYEYSSCAGGYQFDSDRGDTSVVTEWGLVCERRFLSPLNTTLYFLGVLIGAWITGALTDRVGRLPVLAMCLYTQGTLAVALYIIQDYRAFLAVRALQGVFVQGLQTSTYTLLVELYPVRTRTLVGIALEAAWAIGLALLAGLSYAIPDWRVLQLAISVPTAVTVLYIWIIPESPRWLLARGKLTEANMVLESIAKYNNCCCRNVTISQEPDISTAELTVNETITPVKPKRKSRVSNVDLNETRVGDVVLEEATNLLMESFDQNAQKTNSLTDSLEKRISNWESRQEVPPTDDSKEKLETTDRSSAPHENGDSTSNAGSERNREIPQDKVDEIVDLRTPRVSPKDLAITDGDEANGNNDGNVEKRPGTGTGQCFIELLRHKILRRNTAIIIFVWFSVSISYYGIMFHLPDLSGDRHVNFSIGASLELISYIMAYFVLLKFGRRIPLSIYLLLSGSICIVVSAISIPAHKNAAWNGTTRITLILLGKGCVVSCFAIIYLYTVEIFPTVLRGAGLGYCGISARIGSLVAPQLLLLGEYTSVVMPVAVMGALCLVSGIGSLALPETLNEPLPDTIEEAEKLGRKKRPKSKLDEEFEKPNNTRNTAVDEQTGQDVIREKLFSAGKNGGKAWVDAGNGIIVNFSGVEHTE